MAVTRMTIESEESLAGGQIFGDTGPYEMPSGILEFAVDPDHPDNALITDISLASRDDSGSVTFRSNFRILRPVDPHPRK